MSERTKHFWQEWKWEILTIPISFFLLVGFWIWYTYGIGMESPMAPSSMVFIFYALLKGSVFNAASWVMAIVSNKDDPQPQKTFQTWAVYMLSLSVLSLA